MFLSEAKNVVLLGPPGTGKTHLAVGTGIKAAKAGHRVLFDSTTGWVARLQEAHSRGKLAQELVKLCRYSLLVVVEVGYIPFDQDTANLFFQLVSSRYEHAPRARRANVPSGPATPVAASFGHTRQVPPNQSVRRSFGHHRAVFLATSGHIN